MLSEPEIKTFVESRLFSAAPTQLLDAEGALQIAERIGADRAKQIYRVIVAGGPTEAEFRFAEVVRQLDITGAEAMNARWRFVETGAFRIAAELLASGNTKQIQNAAFKLARESNLASSPIAKRILFAFAKSVSGVSTPRAATIAKSKTFEKSKSAPNDADKQEDALSLPSAVIEKIKSFEKSKSAPKYFDEQEDAISLEDIVYRALSKPKKRKNVRKRSGEDALVRVQREIDWIDGRLAQNDIVSAEKGLKDLIKHQLDVSRPEDVVKTLTSVANRAAAFHQMVFADRCLSTAESISTDDPVVPMSRARLFHLYGQDEKALAQYDAAIERFPTDVVGYNGRAETLRALGRLNEALAQYDVAIERFPTEVVSYNGRAETLRALGRLNEALTQYDVSIERFPSDAFGYSGRAETLRALGRLNDALTQYDVAIERFPNDAVDYAGRAETLRALGRLNEALTQYDAVIERFPTDAIGYSGRAETLRALGRLNEALTQYEVVIKRFPTEAYGYTGRAETLRAMGQLNDALAEYDSAIKKFPTNGVSIRGRAYVLILKKDYVAAREALTRTNLPISEGDWIAENILAIADLAEGHIDEAIARLNSGMKECPFLEQKKYFLTTLAVARLRKSKQDAREIEKAESDLEKLKVGTKIPTERGVILLLFAHAAAAKKNLPKAEQYVNEARSVVSAEDFARKRLEREIVRRFQLFETARQPLAQAEELNRDNAVFEAEVQLLAA